MSTLSGLPLPASGDVGGPVGTGPPGVEREENAQEAPPFLPHVTVQHAR